MTTPPAIWPGRDGAPVACREKIKVLEENHAELAQMLRDALEDAVLMGRGRGGDARHPGPAGGGTAAGLPVMRARMRALAACSWPSTCCLGQTPAAAQEWVPRRVAEIQALDKVTARVSVVRATVGEPARYGTLTILVRSCRARPAG
jgi:hypothetical protein